MEADTMPEHTVSVGDVVEDREGTSPDGVVVNRVPKPVSEWYVRGQGPVSEHNPAYPADDRTIIVVYFDRLGSQYPNYTGGRAIPVGKLNSDGVKFYAFPETRLRRINSLKPIEVEIAALRPAPYHARNFSAAANRQYIDAIADRGRPKAPPLVRDCPDGFELLNGHKRVWASYVAGLESLSVECIYLDDLAAAKRWARYHLEAYTAEERAVALDRLRGRFDDTQLERIVPSQLAPLAASQQPVRTDGGRYDD